MSHLGGWGDLGGWGEPPGRFVGSEFTLGYKERTHTLRLYFQ